VAGLNDKEATNYLFFDLAFAFFFFGLALVTFPDLQPQVLHIFLSFHNTDLHRFFKNLDTDLHRLTRLFKN
jgi:hypothetical protein